MIKNIIQKIINFFGYKVTRIKTVDYTNLDHLTKFLTDTEKPIIFDVGANKGQSIIRYKKLFQSPIIHSFEPNIDEVNILKQKYHNDKDLYLNNVAVGDKKGNLEIGWPSAWEKLLSGSLAMVKYLLLI